MVERRPLLAAALSLFYPGLGHVYLREWLRALLWFLLVISTAVLVVPESALQASGFSDIVRAQRDLPFEAALALLAVTAFSMIDAYWLASREEAKGQSEPSSTDDTARCDECNRSFDATEYDFCPWCGESSETVSGTGAESADADA